MLAQCDRVAKRFGGLRALDDVSVAVTEGSITGLIGPNGAGKSTLFAVLSGFVALDSGRVLFQSVDITYEPAHLRARRGIARTFQIVQPFAGLSVRENIAVGAHLHTRARTQALAQQPSDLNVIAVNNATGGAAALNNATVAVGTSSTGLTVYLSDVADVIDGSAFQTNYQRFNGRDAVGLVIAAVLLGYLIYALLFPERL